MDRAGLLHARLVSLRCKDLNERVVEYTPEPFHPLTERWPDYIEIDDMRAQEHAQHLAAVKKVRDLGYLLTRMGNAELEEQQLRLKGDSLSTAETVRMRELEDVKFTTASTLSGIIGLPADGIFKLTGRLRGRPFASSWRLS